ncbi:MAG: MurR/RpiR family transcriptional regulator [Longicatena sp.]
MKNMTVRMRIKSLYREMSSKEKLIADYVLDNIKKVSRSSISEISSELGLADSTFFQFSRKLGYNGFKDFKIALLTEEFDPEISIHEKISTIDSESTIIEKVFDASTRAIEDTRKMVDVDTYKKAVNLMMNSSSVFFFGLGGSNAVALDSYHKFLRSPIKVNYASDAHIQIMNASLLSNKDCAFVISHTGLSKEALEIATLAKENKAKLIALTSYPLSPLAKMADVVLISCSEETTYRSESLSSRLSQLSVIDALFVTIMFKNDKKANESLKKIRKAISNTKE